MVCRNILRRALKRMLIYDDARFWHCRQITTHWKYNRENPAPEQLRLDTASKELLDRVFAEKSSGRCH
jgi:hypothetical protein